jgi:CHAT domain-containing protein/Tfp pilus assembly protein PilF
VADTDDLGDLEAGVAEIQAALERGVSARQQGRLAEALEDFVEAERLCQKHGAPRGLLAARALQGQAVVQLGQGDAEAAWQNCGRAMARLGLPGSDFDDTRTRVGILSTTGMCLRTMGRFGEADHAYRMAVDVARADPGEPLAEIITNYGVLWSHLGEPAQARALYEEALGVLDDHAPEAPMRAWVLISLGGALVDANELPVAISALEQGLEAARRQGSRDWQLQALLALSDCHEKIGDLEQARTYAEQASEIARLDSPDSEMCGRCLNQLAGLELALEDYPAALSASQEAAEVLDKISPESRATIDAKRRLALAQIGTGAIDEAIETAHEAYQSAERLRRKAPAGLGRQAITQIGARATDIYAGALLVRAEGSQDARAFVDALERRQARQLIDRLGQSASDPDPELDRQVRDLRRARREPGRALQHVHWALAGIADRGEASQQELRHAQASAKQALHLIDTQIDRLLSAPEAPETLPAEGIRLRLGPGQCLIHCFVSSAGVAVATATADKMRIRSALDSYDVIRAVVDQIVGTVRARQTVPQAAMTGLARLLFDDVPDQADELIVVADGPLHRLPWALLPDPRDKEPIGISRRLSHARSATAWFQAADRPARPAPNRLLLVGDPAYTSEQFSGSDRLRLTGAARELQAIESRVSAEPVILSGERATEAALMAELPNAVHAHIACHGLVDAADARYSGLILAPPSSEDQAAGHDDLLQAWEIAELDLAGETVILSACSAAAGDVVPGTGLVGLVDAFQLAGARQVMAPLWPIGDDIAPDLMAALYSHLREGHALDEALRLTCFDFRNADPVHWVCWSVHGPGRPAEE